MDAVSHWLLRNGENRILILPPDRVTLATDIYVHILLQEFDANKKARQNAWMPWKDLLENDSIFGPLVANACESQDQKWLSALRH